MTYFDQRWPKMTCMFIICVCSKKYILTGVGKGVGGDVAIVTIGLGVGGGLDVGGNVLCDIVGGFVCPSNVGLNWKKESRV